MSKQKFILPLDLEFSTQKFFEANLENSESLNIKKIIDNMELGDYANNLE